MPDLTTKQKIIKEALNLFSQKGYEAVSVRDLARAVGIKESSLYNHFLNKQAIFDTIVSECSMIADDFFDNIKLTDPTHKASLEQFKVMSDEDFLNMSIGIFQFYLQEENLVKFRKMLTIGQFSNPQVGALYQKTFIDDPLDFQTRVFDMLMDNDILVQADPYLLAMQFYAPIFIMFYKYDEITEEASDLLIDHVILFKETYTKKQADE